MEIIETENVIAEIKRAFSGVKYPGDNNIVINNSVEHLECMEIRKDLGGLDWRKIPLRILRYHHQAPAFMTAAGFRYYIPAYMFATVQNYNRAGNIPDSLVFFLTPPKALIDRRLFSKRISILNSRQKATIHIFLMHLNHKYHKRWPNLAAVIKHY